MSQLQINKSIISKIAPVRSKVNILIMYLECKIIICIVLLSSVTDKLACKQHFNAVDGQSRADQKFVNTQIK